MTRPTDNVRPAAVAGRFYPDGPAELSRMVDTFVDQPMDQRAADIEPGQVRAIIAPHAGYPYSGPTAGVAYHLLRQRHAEVPVERVVLVGPAHYVALTGLATSSADWFATPIGPVPIDRDAVQAAERIDRVACHDDAHAPEHGLEVHLPFVLRVLGNDVPIVPMLFGDAPQSLMARALETLWCDQHTLVIVSSDLSHFHTADEATRIDRATADAIEQGNAHAVGPQQACGYLAVTGLMQLCDQRGLSIRCLELTHSGHTSGDMSRVVGYGGFAAA